MCCGHKGQTEILKLEYRRQRYGTNVVKSNELVKECSFPVFS